MRWQHDLVELKHRDTGLRDYIVHTLFFNPTKVFGYIDDDGIEQGAFIDLFNIIGKRENFVPVFRLKNEYFSKTSTFKSRLNDGNQRPVQVVIIGAQPPILHSIPTRGYIRTPIYIRQSYKFIITPSESYDSYDKITMPFDKTTWIFLIVTFMLAIVIIIILNHTRKHIQVTVYGEGVQMPVYNIISIFFGIGQTVLPSANFPRFILVLFIFFCLIFRTAYQSILFELITSDVQKPLPTSIAELIEQNFTFYQLNGSLSNEDMNQLLYILHRNTSGE